MMKIRCLKYNYRRAVSEKNRADLSDYMGKVWLFFYKNNMEIDLV